ncbi:MAG: pyrroline-5-carboxylate reductase family protein, partial [Limisphaerales bacterium]
MATALAKGFVNAGLIKPAQLIGSDVFAGARDAFAKETGGVVTDSNDEVVAQSTTVFLAVKPQQVADVLGGISDEFTG